MMIRLTLGNSADLLSSLARELAKSMDDSPPNRLTPDDVAQVDHPPVDREVVVTPYGDRYHRFPRSSTARPKHAACGGVRSSEPDDNLTI